MLNTVKPYSRYVLDAVMAIKQHIDDNPLQFKKAAELLDHLQTPHRNSVEKAFKDLYGAGIKEYMVKQRMYEAKKFLKEGLPVYDVAEKCLYESQGSFASAFRKMFGMSPTDWEKASRDDVTASNSAI